MVLYGKGVVGFWESNDPLKAVRVGGVHGLVQFITEENKMEPSLRDNDSNVPTSHSKGPDNKGKLSVREDIR